MYMQKHILLKETAHEAKNQVLFVPRRYLSFSYTSSLEASPSSSSSCANGIALGTASFVVDSVDDDVAERRLPGREVCRGTVRLHRVPSIHSATWQILGRF